MPRKLTIEEFINRSNIIHKNKYDYHKVQYINNQTKVIIICPIHGEFLQAPGPHLCGKGCLICSGKNKLSTSDFIKKAHVIHSNKYDYHKVQYINNQTKVTIICPEHGDFKQRPCHHLMGKGCKKCMKYKLRSAFQLSLNEFILRARNIHGDKYSYSKVLYVNLHSKINIICPKHGMFKQEANSHIHGNGCPKCAYSNKSKKATEWLDDLNIKEREALIKVSNKRYIVDGFDKDSNTIYEYYGDFWHGNPKVYNLNEINPRMKIKFGVLYDKTIERIKTLVDGYNVIYKWETDYNMKVGIKDEN